MRRIERLDPIGDLVVPIRMVGVVHGHAEDLPRRRQELAVEWIADPARAVNRGVFRGSMSTAKMAWAEAWMIVLALIVALATASTSCLMRWNNRLAI